MSKLKTAFNRAHKRAVLAVAALSTSLALTFSQAASAHDLPVDNRIDDNLKRADSTLIIEAETGNVLHSDDADKLRYPASSTKIMVLYMAFEAMEMGLIHEDDMIPVSEHAASMPRVNLALEEGDMISMQDAIYSLITHSANDAAVALGEHIAKNYRLPASEDHFAKLMTLKAHALGMKDTNFANASGLHDARQVTTAKDMAILAQAFIDRFEDPARNDDPYDLFQMTEFEYEGEIYENHNNLLGDFPGAEGMKTGYVFASGYNLVAVVKRDGKRYIGVIFGGESARARDNEIKQLFEQNIPPAP